MVCSLCQPCECWAVLITKSTRWSAGTDVHQTQVGWFTTPLWCADARCWDMESLAIKMLNGSLKMILIGWEWDSGCGQVSQWGHWFFSLLFKLNYIKCKVKCGADSSEISSVNFHITLRKRIYIYKNVLHFVLNIFYVLILIETFCKLMSHYWTLKWPANKQRKKVCDQLQHLKYTPLLP